MFLPNPATRLSSVARANTSLERTSKRLGRLSAAQVERWTPRREEHR
jgi:hypothetical protein